MRLSLVLVLALMLSGCANLPFHHHQQVNRAHKADKYAAPKSSDEMTPNMVVKKRWYDRFKHHPKFFH